MRILLIHQNYPGQFLHLVPGLVQRGHDVVGIGARPTPWGLSGQSSRYLCAGGEPDQTMHLDQPEARIVGQLNQARRVLRQLQRLKTEGWQPDLIVGHPFWGELLLLDEVFAGTPLIALMELDLGGIEMPPCLTSAGLVPAGPLAQWAELLAARRMVAGLTATAFQRSTYPSWLQPQIHVIHEGIDLQRCRPNPQACLHLPDGTTLHSGDPVISFVSRQLEPLRGFLQFMAALPEVLAHNRHVQVVIVGQEHGRGYGPPPPTGRTWKEEAMAQWPSDTPQDRIHFTGFLAYNDILHLFQLSSAHVYLTAPYVLSWSLLEAMGCGCLVVASATTPIEEVIDSGVHGLLVPFGDAAALASQLLEALAEPRKFNPLRLEARRRIYTHFELERCLEKRIKWMQQLCRQL